MRKRIGLIDNLGNIDSFNKEGLAFAKARQIMAATGGNTGNIAFVFGLQHLINHEYIRIHWNTPVEFIQKNVDLLLISCANQLGPHVDLEYWSMCLRKFNTPVALIGIGAQSESISKKPKIPTGTLTFLKTVNELRPNNSANIVTRGRFTSSILNELGYESLALGCPSLQISTDNDLGKSILDFQNNSNTKKICVAAGNPWHQKSAKIEKILTDVVDQFSGAYILQHDEHMISLATGEEIKFQSDQIPTYLEAYCGKFSFIELIEWYRRNAVFFTDVGNWIQFYKRFDKIIGARYHGVALGIQAGRPGTVITIDSRTEELCDETGIKKIDISEAINLTMTDLIEGSRWTKSDAINLSQKKEKQKNSYIDFLKSIDAI